MPRTSNACPILWARVLVSLGMLAAGDFLCALGSALDVVGGSCGTWRRVPVAKVRLRALVQLLVEDR